MSGRRGRSRRVVAVGIVLTLGVAACDRGSPSTEQQLRDAGLPLDTLMTVDEHTQAMVRLSDGAPEMMIFTPDRFGGSIVGRLPADHASANGGQTGRAWSLGAFSDTTRTYGPGWDLLFGAGQGPIEQVVVDEQDARAQIVNPGIGGWVIVVPDTVEIESLSWRLVGADGAVVYRAVGPGLPDDNVLKIDDRTSVTLHSRGGKPELQLFTPNTFGGFDMTAWPADRASVAGGTFGLAETPGPDGMSMTGYHYLFGAGQGPLLGVNVNEPVGRAAIVNPDIDGWVIVVPATIAFSELEWQLIGSDGKQVFAAVGAEPSSR